MMSDHLTLTVGRQNLFPQCVDFRGFLAPADGNPIEPGPMSEAMPIRSFSAEIKRQTANAVVGKIVGEQHVDLCVTVEFLGTQSGADSRVAPAYNQHSHAHRPPSGFFQAIVYTHQNL